MSKGLDRFSPCLIDVSRQLLALLDEVSNMMDAMPPLDRQTTSDPLFLIQRGLSMLRQGRDAEGAILFELAREQLADDQGHFATLLDAFLQGHAEYRHVQQIHQEVNLCFARAHAEQQARVATLTAHLPDLLEESSTQGYTSYGDECTSSSHTLASQSPGFRSPSARSSHTNPFSTEGNKNHELPALSINCFGRFEVRCADHPDQPMTLCTNRKGQAILRYLVAQPGHRATTDKLIDICWPKDESSEALHKLRVATSALRRSLNNDCPGQYGDGYILCKAKAYQLNPAVMMRTDVDAFLALYQAGRQARERETIEQYEAACRLYTGPFLVEDLYADWSFIQRTQMSNIHLIMCHALSDYYLQIGCYEATLKWATKVLEENCCEENAHRQIMHAYASWGRRDEVLRQYQLCERLLKEHLSISPALETTELLQRILAGESSHSAQ